ncbi:MAG: patatin-like phospholipase family protein [Candidatus Nitrosopolaris sp.]|jgi:hypothetical protein
MVRQTCLPEEQSQMFSCINVSVYLHSHIVELTIKDNKDKSKGLPYTADVIVKRVQRAMIFQGGAALGAYEAGTYEAIVEKLVKENEGRKLKGLEDEKRPLFDIVAGTSIGSMNAIVVTSVTEEGKRLEDMKTWEDSVKVVKKFWKYQMSPTILIPFTAVGGILYVPRVNYSSVLLLS